MFSDIGPALRHGDADLGVLIHEGRLTYERDGLLLVEDLGASFERLAHAPVPLGGILARLDLPDDVVDRFAAVLRDSIAYGWAQPRRGAGTIRRHAQELGEDVIWPYVELYVTDHTVDLGDDGMRALETLERTAAAAGALPRCGPDAAAASLGAASGPAARPAASGRRTTARAGSAARLSVNGSTSCGLPSSADTSRSASSAALAASIASPIS